jgi:hypothetical protein
MPAAICRCGPRFSALRLAKLVPAIVGISIPVFVRNARLFKSYSSSLNSGRPLSCAEMLFELNHGRNNRGVQRTAKNARAIDDNQANSPWFYGGHHVVL